MKLRETSAVEAVVWVLVKSCAALGRPVIAVPQFPPLTATTSALMQISFAVERPSALGPSSEHLDQRVIEAQDLGVKAGWMRFHTELGVARISKIGPCFYLGCQWRLDALVPSCSVAT